MRRVVPVLMTLGFLQALALIGCKQPCCSLGDDYTSGHLPLDLPPAAAQDAVPGARPSDINAVSSVIHPEGATRPISLEECIALALENGRANGIALRVLSYDPAIAQTDITTALSRFDATWRTSFVWNETNERIGNALQNILVNGTTVGTTTTTTTTTAANGTTTTTTTTGPTNQQGQPDNAIHSDAATFITGIEKPLPTGGTAGITFQTDYIRSNEDQVFNPNYHPRVVLTLDQPLLQGFGVRTNHLGILISRIGTDLAHNQFAASVQDMLLEVERAYWNCYDQYWVLHSIDDTLGQSLVEWQKAKAGFETGQVRVGNLAQIEQQYQGLRLQRLTALNAVLEAERQLRLVVGLPPEDGMRLVPSDTPTVTPYLPDWQSAVNEALAMRPELVAARQDIARLQLQLEQAKNLTLPDLRFVGNIDTNGTGSNLFGNQDTNAFHDLGSFHWHDWSAGLQLNVPIGFRAAYANVRRTQLALAQRCAALHDEETQAVFALQAAYRNLLVVSEAMRINGAQLKASNVQYSSLKAEFDAGAEKNPTFFLQAQTQLLGAIQAERASIYNYNIALAEFERAKGTLLKHDNVGVAEGPLPGCVQDRASAHIREREEAHVIHTRKEAGMACSGEVVAPMPGVCETPPVLANVVNAKALTTSQDSVATSQAVSVPAVPAPTMPPVPTSPYATQPVSTLPPMLPPSGAGTNSVPSQHP